MKMLYMPMMQNVNGYKHIRWYYMKDILFSILLHILTKKLIHKRKPFFFEIVVRGWTKI